MGGTAGLLYQLLMQRSVDAIPGGGSGYSSVGIFAYSLYLVWHGTYVQSCSRAMFALTILQPQSCIWLCHHRLSQSIDCSLRTCMPDMATMWPKPVLILLQGGDSRFMQAMGSGYARFTFIVVATLLTIQALDLQMTPDADPAHSAATTAKFFTGTALLQTWRVCSFFSMQSTRRLS